MPRITAQHIRELTKGLRNFEDCIKEGLVEYVYAFHVFLCTEIPLFFSSVFILYISFLSSSCPQFLEICNRATKSVK